MKKIDIILPIFLIIFIVGTLFWLTNLQTEINRLEKSQLTITTISETLLCKKMQDKIYLCRKLEGE